uniref:Nuclear pore complex protein Nup205 n=1 Tax=Cacopsylla melanoneura TaxID=428564 RepID=A0A8D8S5Z8_9HEMI
MENKSLDLWSSYKELNQFVETCISRPINGVAISLSKTLAKYKHNFLRVMKNAPKNGRSRQIVESKANGNAATLPQEIVDEAVTLSNMYNLDEQVALDLLCIAQQKCADYPGIARGPVAILLYYDAHFALAATLKMLVQAHQGLRWESNCLADVQKVVSKFVNELVTDGLFEAIFAALSSMNLTREITLLQQNRGLGGAYHHHMVTTLYTGITKTLAEIVLLYSAQCGLPAQPLLALVNHLKGTQPELDAQGGVDDVSLALLMAALYSIDVSIVQEKDDIENIHTFLPILQEDNLIGRVHSELVNPQVTWACPGLRTVIQFAWGLTLASIRSFASNVRSMDNLPEDEDSLVNQCIQENVFSFVNQSLLTAESVFKQELFLRKFHSLVTEFIVLMPIHVRELRATADKECMKIQAHLNEGLHPPNDLTKHFEEFLATITLLYSKDPLDLKLHQDYWCLQDPSSKFKTRTPPKLICLLKFVKQSGEALPSQLFIPYLKMLTALTSSMEVAREVFTMLKNFAPYFCWDHFFTSLSWHLTHLKQDQTPSSDTIYHRHHHHHRGIAPLEVQGLQAVLGLIRTVASHDEMCRQKFCEHVQWNAIQVILSLLTCSVHIELKAELILTLAAFAKSPTIAASLWHQIEASQIIPTIHSTSNFQSRGVLSELEEVESRNEEYPVTRAMLTLLSELTNTPIPFSLGSGTRVPGLDPYIQYILNSVLLTFANRSYKSPAEKWEVARSCVHLLVKFVFDYEPRQEDFTGLLGGGGVGGEVGGVKSNPHPGSHIMLNMCSQSKLLRTIFFIVDEGCLGFDTYAPFPGKTSLEGATLECLRLLSCVLDLQKTFLSFIGNFDTPYMLSGLHKLLFGLNPRSNQLDHAANVAKYITYVSWLPEHAHYSAKILRLLTSYSTAHNDIRSSIVVSTSLRQAVLHGMVKCLEAAEEEEDEEEEQPQTGGGTGEAGPSQPLIAVPQGTSLACKTKVLILKMMLQCLNYNSPNFTQFLCGFNMSNVSKTMLQNAGILGSPRTCLHSIISLLGESLKARQEPTLAPPSPTVTRLCYQLLYSLAAHTATSAPTLRYLRSSNDVLHLHLSGLPFFSRLPSSGTEEFPPSQQHSQLLGIEEGAPCLPSTEDLYQMAWLLKTVAIELRVTSHHAQLSQLKKLVEVLTSQGGLGGDQGQSNSILGSLSQPSGARLIMKLLSLIDFTHRPIEKPSWENFEEGKIFEILEEAEFVAEPNLKKINVKRLQRILKSEIAMVTDWPSLGQKHRVLNEMESVVAFAIRYNAEKQAMHALWSYFQAWKHMAGVLFEVTPQDMMSFQSRFDMLVQLIDSLLEKVQVDMVRPDLALICSESLLLMMSNLRSSFTQERMNREKLTFSQLLCPSEVTILPAIIGWILNSGAGKQQLRANLHAALLTFLHIAREDSLCLRQLALGESAGTLEDTAAFTEDLSILSSLETTVSITSPFNVLIAKFPERLVDTLCIDVTGGHDIVKMLALAILSSMIEVNTDWVPYLSSRGCLKLIIDSLVASDRSLIDVLVNPNETLRPLFVFEAKMAFLTRVALNKQGAELLLEHNLLYALSDMSVFDHHPDIPFFTSPADQYEVSSASNNSKFTQVIMPTLNFFRSILITLGSKNRSATSQLMRFLLDHFESLSLVLRYGSPLLPLSLLKELASLTTILASTYNQSDASDTREFIRLQNLMTALVHRFLINPKSVKDIQAVHPDSDLLDVMDSVLDVQCNVLLFLKNLTAASGLDKRIINVILDPSLTTTSPDSHNEDPAGTTLYSGSRANLGLIVKQLMDGVAHFHHETPSLALLGNKMASVGDMNAATLSELVPNSTMTLGIDETRRLARQTIFKQYSMKKSELTKTRYIIETCLYLVWAHLDYFMLMGVPESLISRTKSPLNKTSSQFPNSTFSETAWDVNADRLQRVREELVTVFNETFSARLVKTADTEKDSNYVEALLRRIKKLIQFAPTDVTFD